MPEKPLGRDDILDVMKQIKQQDGTEHKESLFAYSYYLDDNGEHDKFMKEVYGMFLQSNGLNPIAYPSLRKFENEVVAMTAQLVHAPSTFKGTMTSGGTESIFMAVKTYRERAKDLRGVHGNQHEFNFIMPVTAHPAFAKAGHYFGVEPIVIGVDPVTKRVLIEDVKKAINQNTIFLVGSAPQYPHGTIDPIEELSNIAIEHDLPLHVDSCIGGFVLPFAELLGRKLSQQWDFRVKGVTSISADIHKYGYAPKGSSVILYRSEEYRKYQFFAWSSWPGGLFVSPSALGTRAGGAIATAWATMLSIGVEGYKKITQELLETVDYLKDEVSKIPELTILGIPESTLISFTTKPEYKKAINIFSVADVMKDQYGWKLECNDDSIHMSVMPPHCAKRENLVSDLKKSLEYVKNHPELAKEGTAATYGMVAMVPSTGAVEQFLSALMRNVYSIN
eukprot:TRINITY_DN2927_c0_g1_i3.p1 TRINITY_DN2927_c0_g1~~TRINITY_DN2927_c0_g1_i3.p1  ORF type:complete len:449 (-),score=71.97 TRINITY_DN2927_c0_g1_i3:80-1426(-)